MDIVKETAELFKEREKWESGLELVKQIDEVSKLWLHNFASGLQKENPPLEKLSFVKWVASPIKLSLGWLPTAFHGQDKWCIWMLDNMLGLD